MFGLITPLLIAYLLGSLSGSLLLGRLRGIDIRTQGSGNAGGTNALRTQGWRFALGVVVIDVGKGALAVWLAQRTVWDAFGEPLPLPPLLTVGWLALLAVMAGHVWPLFHGFRGGKGVGTLLGGLLILWPMGVLIFLAGGLLVLLVGGYVSLASVVGVVLLPAAAALIPSMRGHWLVALLPALFVIFTHRANLRRIRAGTESRFERARLLRWRR